MYVKIYRHQKFFLGDNLSVKKCRNLKFCLSISRNHGLPAKQIHKNRGQLKYANKQRFLPFSTKREDVYLLAFLNTHDLRTHSLHNSTLAFFICAKENLPWVHLPQCQMTFLQNVFTRVLFLSDSKATYTLKLRKLLSSIQTETAQRETKKNLGGQTASILV